MSEIEKQFFETFEINKSTLCKYAIYGYEGEQEIWYKCNKRDEECWTYPYKSGCKDRETDYPQITDRILLELICILNDFEGIDVKATTVNELKEELLKQAIEPFEYPIAFEEYHEIDKLYHQLQALFKENN